MELKYLFSDRRQFIKGVALTTAGPAIGELAAPFDVVLGVTPGDR